jgi:hypothetical protein
MKTVAEKKITQKKAVRVAKKIETEGLSPVSPVEPSEESVRLKAEQIYLYRLSRGIEGDAYSDWITALQTLRTIDPVS